MLNPYKVEKVNLHKNTSHLCSIIFEVIKLLVEDMIIVLFHNLTVSTFKWTGSWSFEKKNRKNFIVRQYFLVGLFESHIPFFFGFHSSVLKPDFDLSFGQT